MSSWILAIWITFVPLEQGKEAKELQLSIPHDSYRSCQEEVDKIQGYLDKNPTIKKRFISEDNQYFLVTIQPYESGALNTFRDSITTISSPILNDYEHRCSDTCFGIRYNHGNATIQCHPSPLDQSCYGRPCRY